MIIYPFFDKYDLSGKTNIPFNTHMGSGDGGTCDTIRKLEPGAKVLNGLPVEMRDAEKDPMKAVEKWFDSLKSHRLIDEKRRIISMKETVMALSKKFWDGMLYADEAVMREVADPGCYFVHIGMNADLDHEIEAYTRRIFQPKEVTIHNQEVKEFGDVAVCLTDVDYGLLLGGKPTTHHFMVTEVYQKQADAVKLIQFTFTALVH